MRFLTTAAATLAALAGSAVATNNGLTDKVEWDPYSLIVNGERVYIYSGEFHYQRLPVPELWPDILQKFKASGFNTVSIYLFWSYHSAMPGDFDFENGAKNIQRFFDYCKEAGLYVIPRAGPYCNAETNGGGLALYGSDGSFGTLRSGDETFYQSWKPWIESVGKIIAANQITKGGNVILNQVENELQETSHDPDNTLVKYMTQIEDTFRDAGVVVPLTHNEKGMRAQSWSSDYLNVGGAVDIYGLDSYPGGFSCTNPDSGFNLVRTYYQWFQNYSWTQPSYTPEFEGGWFSNWGGGTFYDDCEAEHSPEFPDVYYKNNIGQRMTLMSIYMAYGGTNWGHSAAPVVYTSYDYSAPLRETRQIWSKLSQTKLIGLFTRVSAGLLNVEMAGNGTGHGVSSDAIWTWQLRNRDTGANFVVTQHDTSKSRDTTVFDAYLEVPSSSGNGSLVTASDVSLEGRQSRILVTDYPLGRKRSLAWCTADIAVWGSFDRESTVVLVLYLKEGQMGEFAFGGKDLVRGFEVYGESEVSEIRNAGKKAYQYTQGAGSTAVKFSDGTVVWLLEQETAWRFWAPPTTLNPNVAPDEQIFVLGPYLVRSAEVSRDTVKIVGDSDVATEIEVFAPSSVRRVMWNGKRVTASKTKYGSLKASISGGEDRADEIELPDLSALDWVVADGLPEKDPSYDDSNWVVCDKNSTLSPTAPVTLPVLFSSDYGFYAGTKIYRGYFTGSEYSGANITASGGLAFGWTAWLNGEYVGGDVGSGSDDITEASLEFGDLVQEGENVITVVVDYTGHDQTSTRNGVENPRGLTGAFLTPGGTTTATGFDEWKVVGAAGEGYGAHGGVVVDPMRGPMNEGGFYAERMGWHLPGFTPSSSSSASSSSSSSSTFSNGTTGGNGTSSSATWTSGSPITSGAGAYEIKYFAASFPLEIPDNMDVPVGFELSAPEGTTARVQFWVNGYQYGKFVPHIGPQTRFPIPPGILNTHGDNWLGVSVWSQQEDDVTIGMEWYTYGVYETGWSFKGKNTDYLRPEWKERSAYA